MDRSEVELKLKAQQNSFDETVKQPNTLERNLVLAEHRTELDRLHKILAVEKTALREEGQSALVLSCQRAF